MSEAYRKLNIVAQAYTPVEGSHATRVMAFVKWGKKFYDFVEVISIAVGNKYPQRGTEAIAADKVTRTYPGFFHAILHGRSHTSHKIIENMSNLDVVPRNRTIVKIFEYFKSLYYKLAIPDSYSDWLIPLTFALIKSISRYEVVLSSSMPNTAHLAVLILKRMKRVYWIADFGDPWTLDKSQEKSKVRLIIEGFLEKRVLEEANVIVFTTENTKRDYSIAYPRFVKKMVVARMGYDLANTEIAPHTSSKPYAFYGGTLPKENRSAKELLLALENLSHMEFVFSGPCIKQVRAYYSGKAMPKNVTLIEWLSHEEYISFVIGATVNIIIGNKNYQQVPGKIYQIGGLSNNILYIGFLDKGIDEAWEILSQNAVWSSNNSESITESIHKIITSPKKPQLESQAYSWETIMNQLFIEIRNKQSNSSEYYKEERLVS